MVSRCLQLVTLQGPIPVDWREFVGSSSLQLAEMQDSNLAGAAGCPALMGSSHLKMPILSPDGLQVRIDKGHTAARLQFRLVYSPDLNQRKDHLPEVDVLRGNYKP